MLTKNHCRHCWWKFIDDDKRIAAWLAEVLGARMKYQWQIRDELGREEPAFQYSHPDERRRWLREGPCKGCPCEKACDRVCGLRAKWWDDRMAHLRRTLGVRGD